MEARGRKNPDPVPRVIGWALGFVAIGLAVFGVLTADAGLLQGAGLVAVSLPVAWLVGVARRGTDSAGGWPR